MLRKKLTYDGFLFIYTHDGSHRCPTHDGLGRAALVRRLKSSLLNRRTRHVETCMCKHVQLWRI
jgi:hypothetical protein